MAERKDVVVDDEKTFHGNVSGDKVHDSADGIASSDASIDQQTYAYSEDRKIGITGAAFLILNKMIGTGSTCFFYFILDPRIEAPPLWKLSH
jgi:hypothetical protein